MPSLPPFIHQEAVPPEKFFNRKKEVELLERMLKVGERRILIAVAGPLKAGKTSLLLKYLQILRKFDDIIPVYLDLRKEVRPILKAAKTIGAWAVEAYNHAKKEDDLAVFFDAVSEKLKSEGKWLVLLLDEFQELPKRVRSEGFLRDWDDGSIFSFFRAVSEGGGRIWYIVTGSAVEAFMDAVSVWGGRFYVIYLGPFTKKDALEMMRSLFSEAGIEASDEFLEEVCDAAGYHPFYMQFMGSVIYEYGRASRLSLREAKRRLWEYLESVFTDYVLRLAKENEDYVKVLWKIARERGLDKEDWALVLELVKKGFLRPRNGRYEFVDPLFKRFVASMELPVVVPPDVTVVGHWAERMVGNYLFRKGYIPFYSHDSRGAFDIFVNIRGIGVGIQVRFSATGVVKLSEKEANRILEAARETGWRPILALVSKNVEFFSDIRPRTYRAGEGAKEIEEALGLS